MAEAMIIPPWMSREYADPATTFLNAFKTGAAISQAQQEMALKAHENQVSTQLQREKIQQDALQSQAQLAATQAYREMVNRMNQAKLEEVKKHNTITAAQAAATLAETQARNREMDEIRKRQVTVDEQNLALNKAKLDEPKYMAGGGVIYEVDPKKGRALPLTAKPQKEATISYEEPETGESPARKISGTPSAIDAFKQSERDKARAESVTSGTEQGQPPITELVMPEWLRASRAWQGPTADSAVKPTRKPVGQRYTDKSGRVWIYTGTEYDPMSDKNPDNWQQE